jgi:hypothetical protein
VKDYSQKKEGRCKRWSVAYTSQGRRGRKPEWKRVPVQCTLAIRRFDQSCIYMFGKLFAVSIFIAIKKGLAVSLKIKIFSVSNYPICKKGACWCHIK